VLVGISKNKLRCTTHKMIDALLLVFTLSISFYREENLVILSHLDRRWETPHTNILMRVKCIRKGCNRALWYTESQKNASKYILIWCAVSGISHFSQNNDALDMAGKNYPFLELESMHDKFISKLEFLFSSGL